MCNAKTSVALKRLLDVEECLKQYKQTNERNMMKTNFTTLMKDLRITLHPLFKSMAFGTANATENHVEITLDDLEKKKDAMLLQAGYTSDEFDKLIKEYYLDFSSDKPEDWIMRHDPEHAVVITPSFQDTKLEIKLPHGSITVQDNTSSKNS